VADQAFGKIADGTEAKLFAFTNAQGVTLKVTDYGARLVAVEVPDRNGKLANVTLGFDSAENYARHTAFFGCTTGRYANRIAKGRFTLDGKDYKLATNAGANHLHGGTKGFDRYVWKSERATGPSNAEGVKFSLQSSDGDEGYPGTLSVTVTYLLTDKNEVRIEYTATTDKPTVLNLTNHAYWNLAGAGNGDVLAHTMMIAADSYLAVGDGLIPTGQLTPVKGTFMDFTEPHTIGSRIAETKKGTPNPNGYDHCYVLRGKNGELALAARAEDPNSGRVMEVLTTEPGVQLYTANFLDGSAQNGGFKQHSAFCLETQHFPDSPNQPSFPTTVLRPGQTYKQTTVHKFSVK
jgi:aldose 1-epimerase